jgi:hypothetical protein
MMTVIEDHGRFTTSYAVFTSSRRIPTNHLQPIAIFLSFQAAHVTTSYINLEESGVFRP